jgi:hypothetical protein
MTMFETSSLRTVDASLYELGCFSVFVRHPVFVAVILRPTKDLAVLPNYEAFANIG